MGNELKKGFDDVRRENGDWKRVARVYCESAPLHASEDRSMKIQDRHVPEVVLELLAKEVRANRRNKDDILLLLEVMRRVLLAKVPFRAIPRCDISSLLDCLKLDDKELVGVSLRVVSLLLHFEGVTGKDRLSWELQNKAHFRVSNGYALFSGLLLRSEIQNDAHMSFQVIDILIQLLGPRSSSTSQQDVDSILSSLRPATTAIAQLAMSSEYSLRFSALHLIQCIFAHAGPETKILMTQSALHTGLLLSLFKAALSPGPVEEVDVDRAMDITTLSQLVLGLICQDNSKATLSICRSIPKHFQSSLMTRSRSTTIRDPSTSSESSTTQHETTNHYKQSFILRVNWVSMLQDLNNDYELPHLIWNQNTRADLRAGIEVELNDVEQQRSTNPAHSWDYDGFEVAYPSLEAHMQVDKYYVGLLFAAMSRKEYRVPSEDVDLLLRDLHHRAVIEDGVQEKLVCIQTMTLIYEQDMERLKAIELLSLPYLIWLLDPKHTTPVWRDAILQFLSLITTHRKNAALFVKHGGLKHIVFYLTRIHCAASLIENEDTQSDTAATNEEVSSMCIDILEKLLHSVPRLKKRIAAQETLQHMFQFLLCSRSSLSRRMVSLIAAVLQESSADPSRWVSSGLVEALFYAIPRDESIYPELVQILKDYVFRNDDTACSHLIPHPLRRIIFLHGTDAFIAAFHKETCDPHLIWNNNLRQLLMKQVENSMQVYRLTLEKNHLAVVDMHLITRVMYPSIDDELCIGAIYLRLFLREPSFSCEQPDYVTESLVQALSCGLTERDLTLLLQSLERMVDRHSSLAVCRKFTAFPILVDIIRRGASDSFPVEQGQIAATCALRLLDCSAQADGNHTRLIHGDGILSLSSSLLLALEAHGSSRPDLNSLMQSILMLLTLLLQRCGEDVVPSLSHQGRLLKQVAHYMIDYQNVLQHPELCNAALQFVKTCCAHDAFRQEVLQFGALLHLVYLTIFFESHEQENLDSPINRITPLAAEALSTFSTCIDPRLGKADGSVIVHTLRCLLTPGLVRELSDANQFVFVSRKDTSDPVLVWNADTRDELKRFLTEEVVTIRKTFVWNTWKTLAEVRHTTVWETLDLQPSFEYTSLKDYIIVDDVFLYEFNESTAARIPNSAESFYEQLLRAIDTKTKELHFDLRQHSDQLTQAYHYIRTIAKSLLCLIHWHGEILSTTKKAMTLSMLQSMLEPYEGKLNPYRVEAGLLILEEMSHMDITTTEFVRPFVHTLHRVLNMERAETEFDPNIERVLGIMAELCLRCSSVLSDYCESGLVVTLVYILACAKRFSQQQRRASALMIGILAHDPKTKDAFMMLFCQLLVDTFREDIIGAKDDPDALVSAFDQDYDTPIRFWNQQCRDDVVHFMEVERNPLLEHQRTSLLEGVDSEPYNWVWFEIHERLYAPTLKAQVRVDGIYVESLNANPFFQIQTQRYFSQAILALHVKLNTYKDSQAEGDETKNKLATLHMQVLWESILNIMTNSPHFQSSCVAEISFIFSFLHPSMEYCVQDVVLQLVAILATNSECALAMDEQQVLSQMLPLIPIRAEGGDTEMRALLILGILLDALRRSGPLVRQLVSCGTLVFLFRLLLDTRVSHTVHVRAAQVVSAMAQDSVFGQGATITACHMLTIEFRDVFKSRPERFVQFAKGDHESKRDGRSWNQESRKKLLHVLSEDCTALSKTCQSWDGRTDLWDVSRLQSVWPGQWD